jgi:hypothetical protein
VEPDAEPCLILQTAALFHQRDGSLRFGAGGNRHRVVHAHVAGDPRAHHILDLGCFTRHGGVDLQSDHRVGWDDQFLKEFLRRLRNASNAVVDARGRRFNSGGNRRIH